VFQTFNLLPRMALENGPASRRHHHQGGATERWRGSATWARSRPSQLSGGQQQVAIARALQRPRLILADDHGNLDTRTSVEIISNRSGITVVLVTHEDDIAQCGRRVRDERLRKDTPVATPRTPGDLPRSPEAHGLGGDADGAGLAPG
jgi:putative ABC transport system ATP-binding protein